MRGLNCCGCGRNQPYLTAYEIAVKHGFKGTEAEWIASLDRVRVVKVTGRSGDSFTCDQDLATIRDWSREHVVVLLIPDGRYAWWSMNGEDEVGFTTGWYETADGQAYDAWIVRRTGGIVVREVIEWSSETREMAWEDIKPAGGVPGTDLSLDVQASLAKADTAYQLPLTGMPESSLSLDVQSKLNVFPVRITANGGSYSVSESALAIYTAWQNGRTVIAIDPGGIMMLLQSSIASRAVFSGTVDLGTSVQIVTYTVTGTTAVQTQRSGYVKPDGGIPWTDLDLSESVFTVTITGGEHGYAADHTFYEMAAAQAAGKRLEFRFGDLRGEMAANGELYMTTVMFDVTTAPQFIVYMFIITGTGVIGYTFPTE